MNDCYLAALGAGVRASRYILFSGVVCVCAVCAGTRSAVLQPVLLSHCKHSAHFINTSATAEPYIMVCVAGLVGFWWILKNSTLSKSSAPAWVALTRSNSISLAGNEFRIQRATAAIQKQFWWNSIGIFSAHSVVLWSQVHSSEALAITAETPH